MSKKEWTKPEIEQLLVLRETLSAREIAEQLNRSEHSIRNKLYYLTGRSNCQVSNSSEKSSQPWTTEELEKLKALAATDKPYEQIAAEMNRSVGAVRAKVHQYKIIVNGAEKRSWTREEDAYLIENWGSVSIRTMQKALHRTDIAIRQRACINLRLGRADELTDYVKLSEFADLSGISRDRITTSLVRDHGFPLIRKVVLKRRGYFVDLDKVLKWMEGHQALFDASKISNDLFAIEPDWLKQKRIQDRKDKSNLKSCAVVRIWSEEDRVKLKDMVTIGYSYSEIAQYFGVTKKQIERRIEKYGFSYRSPNFWKGSDFKYIKDHWETMSDAEMAKHLHKSTTAITSQRNKMGLLRTKKKVRYTAEEEAFIRANWQTMSDQELAEELNRATTAISTYRLKLGLLREEKRGGPD